jgi:hypothetical protein
MEDDMHTESTLTKHQHHKHGPKVFTKNGQKYRITANVRYDDDCGNGHNSFSITGDVDRQNEAGHWYNDSGGCIHDEIAKHFPELRPFIKWHLCSSNGPMHYTANTLYLAGDKDHHGKREGEALRTELHIEFDANPIKHKMKRGFTKWLKTAVDQATRGVSGPYDFEIIQIDHDHKPGDYKFNPKFTFGGFASKWHECPFDTEDEAINFLHALQHCSPRFINVITDRSEGKEPDLEAARSTAIWPNATLEQLQSKEQLDNRLAGLLTEFRADVEGMGFTF